MNFFKAIGIGSDSDSPKSEKKKAPERKPAKPAPAANKENGRQSTASKN